MYGSRVVSVGSGRVPFALTVCNQSGCRRPFERLSLWVYHIIYLFIFFQVRVRVAFTYYTFLIQIETTKKKILFTFLSIMVKWQFKKIKWNLSSIIKQRIYILLLFYIFFFIFDALGDYTIFILNFVYWWLTILTRYYIAKINYLCKIDCQ